ncbi:MAG: NADP-dependent phosphogluconate dehydrogenase [Deltaproteobacteria bacterium]|nr:NADP-dependent phosphogluconate dehydrogenase [Deltaproteobacteria bacterium]
MSKPEGEIGVVGLGTMGRNLALNFADHGFPVAVYNRTAEKTRDFMAQVTGRQDIRPGYVLKEFVGLLRRPRAILIMVAAGEAVDVVIKELFPLLAHGDLLIDGGNSHFTDTSRRARVLAGKGIWFMGLGVSGGEAGARYGPSLMPGCHREAYSRVEPLLVAAAAQVDGEPCVAYLGPGSAGHYVKMVHNGIEYAIIELIAETYDLMRRGLGLTPEELHGVYAAWNDTELNSFLVEITARIFLKKDEKTGKPLIDLIRDEARQKGTGMWTSWEAMDLQVGTPTIDIAVVLRDLSGYKAERQAAAQVLKGPEITFGGDRARFLEKLKSALYAGMIAAYAQGLALLKQASATYNYALDLETVARIWRGGCIIRAALLEEIRAAFRARPDLNNLLLDPKLARQFMDRQRDLRDVVSVAVDLGLPAPGLMMTLAYFDAYRSARLPANLIQAQRDYFGAHTYERLDAPGAYHTQWDQD